MRRRTIYRQGCTGGQVVKIDLIALGPALGQVDVEVALEGHVIMSEPLMKWITAAHELLEKRDPP